jgi:hypothetical protein
VSSSSSSINSLLLTVFSCVSNSGSWGRGGLFTALSNLSNKPQKNYESSKLNQDLKLGDAHLIHINKNIYVVNVVAQKVDKKSSIGVSGIIEKYLTTALLRVACAAIQKKAEIHMPRIGYGLPNFSWYSVERIIKKCLARQGIKTFM